MIPIQGQQLLNILTKIAILLAVIAAAEVTSCALWGCP